MPALVRFVIFNLAIGALLGLLVAAVLVLGDAGGLAALAEGGDRLLAFAMLALTLGPSFALGCLATALCFGDF